MTRPPLPPELGPLNPQQEAAVLSIDGPLLILAGAGSGKTRVLTRRIAYMLHAGIPAENLFAVTFTKKAAMEMKERVIELVGERGDKVWVSTFHASCGRILRMEAEALGYTTRFSIYDDDDQLRMIKQIIVDLGYDLKVVVPKGIIGRIDHHKNRMEGIEELLQSHRIHAQDPLIQVWAAYEEALRASDAMDFNDLIGKTVQLFTEHPDILQKYQELFQYVMVDEYQDTNRSQYLLLTMLTSGHRNLAVVGDDDQSIYGFRGADISNILSFEKDFPDATIVRMEQNYRCTDSILAVANAVVAKNTERIVKRLWTETTGGALVTFMVHDDARKEADAVGRAILQLRRKGYKYSDICVIYRTNATAKPYMDAFATLNLPHKVVGGRGFYERREIRDAICYLRLIANPADDAALLRVCNVPTRGIGTVTVQELRKESASRGEPLLKTARSLARGSGRTAKALAEFVTIIDHLTELAQTASLVALCQEMLLKSGYLAMLEAEDTTESKERIHHLRLLLKAAASFDPGDEEIQGPAVLSAFLQAIALSGKDEEIPEEGEVTLMTVHNSKGLEYPVVFVVNMVEGQFPHARSAEEEGGIAEERRLAYVAFTRAQKKLVISRVRQQIRRKSDKAKPKEPGKPKTDVEPVAPSRFLFGIPLEVCDGELPDVSEDDPDKQLQPPDHVVKRKTRLPPDELKEFLDHQRVRMIAPKPPPHRLQPIVDRAGLTQGTKVFHARFGKGEIQRKIGASLRVDFGSGPQLIRPTDDDLMLLNDG